MHVHSFVTGVLTRRRGIAEQVPLVYQPHAWPVEFSGSRLVGPGVFAWERHASSRTAWLVTNCDDEISEGRHHGITTPATAIGVAVDLEHFHTVGPERVAQLRAEFGLGTSRVIVSIGRMSRQKGQDLLVGEWEQHRPGDATLVLVGPGRTESLQRLAPREWGRSIRAIGHAIDVRPWLWASDVLVLSSRYETVGLVVAEALACGRPVVANDVNGVRQILTEGPGSPAGVVVPALSPRELLEETGRLLADEVALARHRSAARPRAEHTLRQDALMTKLDDAYQAAITRCRSGWPRRSP